nr:transmembrane protein 68 [Danaus plexippus plexippus]
MVENQCKARPVKAFIMSDLLTKFDSDATNDIVKVAVVVVFCLLYLEYVDTEYSLWLSWFLTPVIVTFLLPAVIIVLIYVSSIIFHLYRLYRLRVVDGVHNDWRHAARLAVCALWDAHGWLWHGTYHHIYYTPLLNEPITKPCDLKTRLFYTIKKWCFMMFLPGWSSLLEGLCVIPGTVQTCAGVLRSGNSLAISPGGVYEAQFGDHYYKLNWKSRIGFAKVALEAKVPIVPMFTQNVREAFRTVGWLRGICLRIYAATRVPLAPVYGGFPVKLVTHVGTPIPYDASLTPETLQVKVASAIEDLVEEHQRVPGSILLALIERVYEMPKKKKVQTNGSCHNGVAKQNNFPDKCDTDRSDVDPVKSDVDPVKSDVDSGKCDSDRSDKKVS